MWISLDEWAMLEYNNIRCTQTQFSWQNRGRVSGGLRIVDKDN